MMYPELRFRQIHLDFHTSEHIPDVGIDFDAEEFVNTLKYGNVDSVTLFARCHHGWCYYPSKIGKSHPNLKRPDLLGEMIVACRNADIATPVYLSVQWDELIAREQPGWRVMNADNSPVSWPGSDRSTSNQLTATWHPICLTNNEYVRYVIALADEIIHLYEPEGFFMDILQSWECVCPRCIMRMQERGLDPNLAEHRRKNDRDVIIDFYQKFSEAVWSVNKNLRIFFNGGHVYKGDRDRYKYFSHIELESLPTGGWSYEHFPVSARYVDTIGHQYIGMTGKFHTSWGEFGGIKRSAALEYECTQMIAMGARCSIGDQLHPKGKLDRPTYDIIRPAYHRVNILEQFATDAVYQRQIAILSVEATDSTSVNNVERYNLSDDGAARMLLELQRPFDVIDTESDFTDYRLLILPDEVVIDNGVAQRLIDFIQRDGSIIMSGQSGMDLNHQRFLIDIGVAFHGEVGQWYPDYLEASESLDPDLIDNPFVIYERPFVVHAVNAQILARSRRPYFNRTWEHFCSHQHSPFKPDEPPYCDSMIQHGRVIYFAHPIFKAYHKTGQPLLKYLFRGALSRLLKEKLIETNLPSAARSSLLYQPKEDRHILHLLYAPTQTRGSNVEYPSGQRMPIEIIEDAPTLRDVEAVVRLNRRPVRIYEVYDRKNLEWDEPNTGYIRVCLPSLYIHGAIVFEYRK
jgi:hypothetical protein